MEQAFALLSASTVDRAAMTLSELSRHAGLPPSTTHRLVASLVRDQRPADRDADVLGRRPVRGPDGDVVAVVSVVVPTETRTGTVVPAVRTCGLAISRALGRATP